MFNLMRLLQKYVFMPKVRHSRENGNPEVVDFKGTGFPIKPVPAGSKRGNFGNDILETFARSSIFKINANIQNKCTTHDAQHTIVNQRGTALVVSLFMLVIITAMGITATNRTIVEGWLSANYRLSKQAFYVAEAGLERTRNDLKTDLDWSNNTTAPGGRINVGGREGSYTITIVGMPQRDSITVRSRGTIAGATSVVEALIKRGDILPIPGAVNLVGDIAVDDIDFDEEDEKLLIDGRNYKLVDQAGTPTTGTDTRLGISVNNAPGGRVAEIIEDNDLNKPERKGMIKGHGSEPSINTGTSINIELTKRDVSKFVSTIKNKNLADITLTDPLGQGGWPTDMGTVENPKIVYVKITEEIEIEWPIRGAGILIIEGSGDELEVELEEGSIDWKGLVIITGKDVDVELEGEEGTSINIRGALVVSENSADEGGEIEIDGNVELLYSREALNLAQQRIPAIVSSWRQVHD